MSKLLGYISLGCAKNLVDTEVMLGALQDNGYEITEELEKAEIIIINTCTFIEKAKEETGLTVLFITLVSKLDIETDGVDGQSDGYGGYEFKEVVTSIELDTEYLYTYY